MDEAVAVGAVEADAVQRVRGDARPEDLLGALQAKLRPIARLGYYDYTVVNEVFEMRIPNASAAELAGLEGSPR